MKRKVYNIINIGKGLLNITSDNLLLVEDLTLSQQVTTEEMNALTPSAGEQVYNTDTNTYWYWNGTEWVENSTNFIPITGTIEGKPVTGDITFNSVLSKIKNIGTLSTPYSSDNDYLREINFVQDEHSLSIFVEHLNNARSSIWLHNSYIELRVMSLTGDGDRSRIFLDSRKIHLDSNVVVGADATPQAQLDIIAKSTPTTQEKILRLSIEDVSNFIEFRNNTSADGVFNPALYGLAGAQNAFALEIIGDVDGNDTGTLPTFRLQGRSGAGPTASRDILAISNFGNELFRVTRLGNVGIGTNSPKSKLEIASQFGAAILNLKRIDGATGGGKGSIVFKDSQDYAVASINSFGAGVDNSGTLIFRTSFNEAQNNGYILPERMRITSAGNVGIGTTNPQAKLDVVSTNSGSLPCPRMTASQRLAINTPSVGTMVYQTDVTAGLYIFKNGTGWKFIK